MRGVASMRRGAGSGPEPVDIVKRGRSRCRFGAGVGDCVKRLRGDPPGKKAMLVFGYDYEGWQMDPAIDAFEVLARSRVELGGRQVSRFGNLVHPVHQRGRVFLWEVLRGRGDRDS